MSGMEPMLVAVCFAFLYHFALCKERAGDSVSAWADAQRTTADVDGTADPRCIAGAVRSPFVAFHSRRVATPVTGPLDDATDELSTKQHESIMFLLPYRIYIGHVVYSFFAEVLKVRCIC